MNSQAFKKLEIANLAVTVVAAAVGFLFFSFRTGVGLLAGTLLMSVNFFVLRRITAFLMSGQKKMGAALTLLFLKLALFFGVVWAAMTYLPMNALAFGLGAAIILLTVTLTSTLSRTPPENA